MNKVMILQHIETGRFHAALFYERPFPGPDAPVTRWASRLHHTAGAATIKEAREHAQIMATRFDVPGWRVDDSPTEWDGSTGIMVLAHRTGQ